MRRCWFFQCKWLWHFNVPKENGGFFGVYQCHYCKTISGGAARFRNPATGEYEFAPVKEPTA